MKKKILFFIPDLRYGGAEKVLVNLLNNMDREKYDISLLVLFDEGVNKQYLREDIGYKYIFKKVFRGNSHLLKLFKPETLYRWFVKEEYDILVAYLEGIPTRVFSGCKNKQTKKLAWVHVEMDDKKKFFSPYRSFNEAMRCYSKFDGIVGVAETVISSFKEHTKLEHQYHVKYNTVETEQIISKSLEPVEDVVYNDQVINVISVGRLAAQKGYDRLLRVFKKILDKGVKAHLYILGQGELEGSLRAYIVDNQLQESITLLGFKDNPYKYVKNADLFVCSSYKEGFSTAVTEALIVGTPVITTVCSGMREMLGENQYGIVVENEENALYEGLYSLLQDKEKLSFYKQRAEERGKFFSKEETVKAVENLLDNL